MGKKDKKAEKIIREFGENLETFAEKFTDLMEKTTSYLDTTNKLTLLGSLSNYSQETKQFQNDLHKYGMGIFLWFESDYPNIAKVFEQCGFLPTVVKIKDVKKCVDEFNQLISQTSKNYPNLASLEVQESQTLFENSYLDLIKILIIKSHLWRKIDENTAIYINEFTKILPALKIYIELVSKTIRIESARLKFANRRKTTKNAFKSLEKLFKRINREFYKKCPEEIVNEIKKLGDFGKTITRDLNYIKEHKREDFYYLLELTKDLFEFHIDLVKYILRLWHINEYGNRNYVNNYKIKHQFPNIKTIIHHYLKQKLALNFPNLTRVLIGFFLPFEKYRHIESHSVPNLSLSADGKHILIPQKGKKSKLKVNIGEFQKQIRTYQCFIEALGIYR
ncbi:MAG: hypothetical protein ACTSRP_13200 [Candidatus Helarchaeota archaeon]